MKRRLRTGELANAAGVKATAVRYYERRGLLPEPARTEKGYRLYPPEAVTTLRFIRRAQGMGFSLKEIRELLVARSSSKACAELCAAASAKADALVTSAKRAQTKARKLRALVGVRNPRTRSAEKCPVNRHLEDNHGARRRNR